MEKDEELLRLLQNIVAARAHGDNPPTHTTTLDEAVMDAEAYLKRRRSRGRRTLMRPARASFMRRLGQYTRRSMRRPPP